MFEEIAYQLVVNHVVDTRISVSPSLVSTGMTHFFLSEVFERPVETVATLETTEMHLPQEAPVRARSGEIHINPSFGKLIEHSRLAGY